MYSIEEIVFQRNEEEDDDYDHDDGDDGVWNIIKYLRMSSNAFNYMLII